MRFNRLYATSFSVLLERAYQKLRRPLTEKYQRRSPIIFWQSYNGIGYVAYRRYSVCQTRWKSGAPFLSYKQKPFSKNRTNIENLCVFAGEMYSTICWSLATALVQSRLNYSNSLLYGTSLSNLHELQMVKTLLPELSPNLPYLHLSSFLTSITVGSISINESVLKSKLPF